jgi:hypothetical protein
MLDDIWSRIRQVDEGWWFLLVVLSTLLIHALWVRHQEKGMSAKQRRTRYLKAKEEVEDTITYALEEKVKSGLLERGDVDYWYRKLHKAGLTELGFEPTGGRPWYAPGSYRNPTRSSTAVAVKRRIQRHIDKLRKTKEGNKKKTMDSLIVINGRK